MPKKLKGPAFEREICKQLSLWWTFGKDDSVFWRTAMSGGRATVRGRKGLNTIGSHGDIGCVSGQGTKLLDIMTLELKRGYSHETISDIIEKTPEQKEPTILAFIRQAVAAKRGAKSLSWALIWKRDRRWPMIVMPTKLSDALNYRGDCIRLEIHTQRLTVCRLADWLDCVSPNAVRRLWNKTRC